MRFTIDLRIAAPLADVEATLLDPEFVAATTTLPKLGGAKLLDERRDGDTISRRIQYRFTGELSAAVTAVVQPSKLTWVDASTYDLSRHRSEHRIIPDNYGDRFKADYHTELSAEGDVTRRRVTGSITVRVPLVGGRVEQGIAAGLREYAEAEGKLVEQWVGEHGDP